MLWWSPWPKGLTFHDGRATWQTEGERGGWRSCGVKAINLDPAKREKNRNNRDTSTWLGLAANFWNYRRQHERRETQHLIVESDEIFCFIQTIELDGPHRLTTWTGQSRLLRCGVMVQTIWPVWMRDKTKPRPSLLQRDKKPDTHPLPIF